MEVVAVAIATYSIIILLLGYAVYYRLHNHKQEQISNYEINKQMWIKTGDPRYLSKMTEELEE